MSPRERHSSGTVITINHNLLPIYMPLSTPCFNFFISDKVFCTLGVVAQFSHLQKSSVFPLPPKIMLYILPPSISLYLSIPTSQHSVIALSVPICSSWIDCHHINLLPWSVKNKPTSPVHTKLWPASSEGFLLLLSGEAGQTIRTGHQCDYRCPLGINNLKV